MVSPTIPLKQCSRKEDCIHPSGPRLPATTDYFSPDKRKKSGLMAACKVCRNATSRSKNPNPSAERYRRIQAAQARGMKYCPPCETEYPPTLEFWYPDTQRRDRLSPYCRNCHKAQARQWTADNPERVKQRSHDNYWQDPERARQASREYRLTHVEERREYNRQYAADHAEEARARTKQWVQDNRERKRLMDRAYHLRTYDVVGKRESIRAWRHAHPAGARAQLARRRARIKGAGGTFTADDIALLMKAQGNTCWWCPKKLTTYHIDHKIPLARGGTNDPANLCLACPDCNLSKGAKLPGESIGRLL